MMISRMAMAGDLICAPVRVNPLEMQGLRRPLTPR